MKWSPILSRQAIATLMLLVLALLGSPLLIAGAQAPNNSLSAADGNPSNAVYVDANGKVGIGIQAPEAKMHIYGYEELPTLAVFPGMPTPIGVSETSVLIDHYAAPSIGSLPFDVSANIRFRAQYYYPLAPIIGADSIAGRGTGSIGVTAVEEPSKNGYAQTFAIDAESPEMPIIFETHGREQVRVNPNGNVGIGTTSPQTRLDVGRGPSWTSGHWGASVGLSNGSAIGWAANAAGQRFGMGHTNRGFVIFRTASDLGTTASPTTADLFINDNGNVGVGTTSPQEKLDVAGTTRTQVLEITGGADLAEPFQIAGTESIQSGMVVAIDPDHPGQLRVSDKAYDPLVAGVISGAGGVAPGITMHQDGTITEGDHLVSLTGRVYVWVDTSNGSIQPGDFLTTSNSPGYAMKVVDHDQAHGAILGKAMTSLDSGRGLVLVLISLQ